MGYKNCVDCRLDFAEDRQFCANCGKSLTFLTDSSEEAKPSKNFFRNRVKLSKKNLFIASGILAFYLGGTVLAYFNDGPRSTVEELVDAIKNKDIAALARENLFSNESKLDVLPDSIVDAISTNQSDRLIELDWEPGFQTARAVVTYSDGEVLNLNLDSSFGWWAVFPGKEWKVVAQPTTLKIQRSEFFSVMAELGLGDGKAMLSDFVEATEIAKEYISFPGTFVGKVSANGVFDETNITKSIEWAESNLVSLNEETLKVSKKANTVAASRANSAVQGCVAKKCSSLPYISVDWSPYSPDSYYDNRVRTNTYTKGTCDFVSWQPIAEDKAGFLFECDITLTALEVQVNYYRYFSDDYDYYYGTGKGKMQVKIEVEASSDGNFKVSSARLQ